ncbi:unnamed protein product [Rotaria sp. Silwood1]|nr:unnamed protein product [Rotaria sp. Silwood1]CAF4723437.1 unnamed protein product [Rotaria sp. Silwood1]
MSILLTSALIFIRLSVLPLISAIDEYQTSLGNKIDNKHDINSLSTQICNYNKQNLTSADDELLSNSYVQQNIMNYYKEHLQQQYNLMIDQILSSRLSSIDDIYIDTIITKVKD